MSPTRQVIVYESGLATKLSEDLDRKMLHDAMRLRVTREEAVLEVLATVCRRPNFSCGMAINLCGGNHCRSPLLQPHRNFGNAACPVPLVQPPDDELLGLAKTNALADALSLRRSERMLDDPRSRRFAKHFVLVAQNGLLESNLNSLCQDSTRC